MYMYKYLKYYRYLYSRHVRHNPRAARFLITMRHCGKPWVRYRSINACTAGIGPNAKCKHHYSIITLMIGFGYATCDVCSTATAISMKTKDSANS